MGTFTLIPDSGSISSGFFPDNTAPGVYGSFALSGLLSTGLAGSFPRILEGFDNPIVATIDNLLRLNFSLVGNIISLDGNPAISFAGLPAGFTITAATINFYIQNNASDATSHFRVQFDAPTESGDISNSSGAFRSFVHPGPLPSVLSFFSNGCGIHVDNTVVGQQTSRWVNNWLITGTYSIIPVFIWTVQTPIGNFPVPVNLGNNIIINAGGASTPGSTGTLFTVTSSNGGLNGVASIQLQYTDSNSVSHTITILAINFISQSANLLVFLIPFSNLPYPGSGPPYSSGPSAGQFGIFQGTVNITAIGDGIVFSGSLPIGAVTILFASGSGIYRIVKDKIADTLYDRVIDATTQEVKIPDPFIKTGFIGG
jgi:hypothetical protein